MKNVIGMSDPNVMFKGPGPILYRFFFISRHCGNILRTCCYWIYGDHLWLPICMVPATWVIMGIGSIEYPPI